MSETPITTIHPDATELPKPSKLERFKSIAKVGFEHAKKPLIIVATGTAGLLLLVHQARLNSIEGALGLTYNEDEDRYSYENLPQLDAPEAETETEVA